MPGDVNFGKLELLLKCNGTNGGKNIKDFSPRNQNTIFIAGAETSTAQSKFNGSSLRMPHTQARTHTQLTGSIHGGMDFTIELWIYPTSASNSTTKRIITIISVLQSTVVIYETNTNRLQAIVFIGGALSTYLTITSTTTGLTANSWQHIALVKNGNTYTLYKAGASVASGTNANKGYIHGEKSKDLVILGWIATEPLLGETFYQDVAIYSYAKYTAAFTPSAVPIVDNYGVISGNITESLAITDWRVSALACGTGNLAGDTLVSGSTYSLGTDTLEPCNVVLSPRIDAKWNPSTNYALNAYIVPSDPDASQRIYKLTSYIGGNPNIKNSLPMVLKFEGANGSTTIVDSGESARALTVSGNAQISTARFKFGSSSLLLDGTGDFITHAAPNCFEPIKSIATISGWFYMQATPSSTFRIFSVGGGVEAFNGTTGIHIALITSVTVATLQVSNNTASPINIVNTQAIPINTWHHFSVVLNYTTNTAYVGINGTVTSGSIAAQARPTAATITMQIGSIPGTSTGVLYFNGNIDDFALINGFADPVFMANYTVPTVEYNHLPPLSGATEPTWPTSGTVNDGDLQWTFVDNLVDPRVLGPKIPV